MHHLHGATGQTEGHRPKRRLSGPHGNGVQRRQRIVNGSRGGFLRHQWEVCGHLFWSQVAGGKTHLFGGQTDRAENQRTQELGHIGEASCRQCKHGFWWEYVVDWSSFFVCELQACNQQESVRGDWICHGVRVQRLRPEPNAARGVCRMGFGRKLAVEDLWGCFGGHLAVDVVLLCCVLAYWRRCLVLHSFLFCFGFVHPSWPCCACSGWNVVDGAKSAFQPREN